MNEGKISPDMCYGPARGGNVQALMALWLCLWPSTRWGRMMGRG